MPSNPSVHSPSISDQAQVRALAGQGSGPGVGIVYPLPLAARVLVSYLDGRVDDECGVWPGSTRTGVGRILRVRAATTT